MKEVLIKYIIISITALFSAIMASAETINFKIVWDSDKPQVKSKVEYFSPLKVDSIDYTKSLFAEDESKQDEKVDNSEEKKEEPSDVIKKGIGALIIAMALYGGHILVIILALSIIGYITLLCVKVFVWLRKI